MRNPLLAARHTRSRLSPRLRTALALLRALPPDLAEDVSAVTVSSADLATFTLRSRTIVWGGAGEAERKVEIVLKKEKFEDKVVTLAIGPELSGKVIVLNEALDKSKRGPAGKPDPFKDL